MIYPNTLRVIILCEVEQIRKDTLMDTIADMTRDELKQFI
jgi:hypothetical protein